MVDRTTNLSRRIGRRAAACSRLTTSRARSRIRSRSSPAKAAGPAELSTRFGACQSVTRVSAPIGPPKRLPAPALDVRKNPPAVSRRTRIRVPSRARTSSTAAPRSDACRRSPLNRQAQNNGSVCPRALRLRRLLLRAALCTWRPTAARGDARLRLEHDLRPAVIAGVEVPVGLGCLIERQLV